jgi:hypothetical protein
MLSIPLKLMITPLNILHDPIMGDIFSDARDILRGGSHPNNVVLILLQETSY